MTEEEQKTIAQLKSDVEQLNKYIREFNMLIGGSSSYDYKGLLERQKADEDHRAQQVIRDMEFKQSLTNQLTELRHDFDDKFSSMKCDVEKKLEVVVKLETYFNLVTNKTLWKVLIIILVGGGGLIAWAKGGYDVVIKLINKLL